MSRVDEELVLAEMERQRKEGLYSPGETHACACIGGPRCCLIKFEAARRLRTETGDTRSVEEVQEKLRKRYGR